MAAPAASGRRWKMGSGDRGGGWRGGRGASLTPCPKQAALTRGGAQADLPQVLLVLGEVLVERLLPDAPRVQSASHRLQLLGVLQPPPAALHLCKAAPRSSALRRRHPLPHGLAWQSRPQNPTGFPGEKQGHSSAWQPGSRAGLSPGGTGCSVSWVKYFCSICLKNLVGGRPRRLGCPGTSWSFSRLLRLLGQAPWALASAWTGVEASRGDVGSSAGSPFSWRGQSPLD